MCGNLRAAIESLSAEEIAKMPEAYKIFHATGKDLEKMSAQIAAQNKEIASLKEDVSGVKEDVSGVKKDVSVVNAKVDTLTTVLVEVEKLVKEHFSPEHVKETVVGQSILMGLRTKRFWLGVLVFLGLMLLAGIGIYNIVLTNPQVARDIIQAASVAA